MRFEVPQFIGVEDKIFGPLTIKQFIYLVGAGCLAYIGYRYLPLVFAVLFGLPVLALGLALTFYRVNNKPFIFTLEAAVKYIMGARLYVWHKIEKGVVVKKEEERSPLLYVPKMSGSKLKDLTWNLDVKESASLGGKETMQSK